MPVPAIVNDGDFTIAQPNGAPVYSFPFWSKGDSKTFTAKQPVRVEISRFKMPILMSQKSFPNIGKAYLVDISNPEQIAGSNLMEYDEIYASLPSKRLEYGQASYTPQYADPASQILFAFTDLYDATWVYEYSLYKPLPSLYSPKLFKLIDGIFQSADFRPIGIGNDRLVQNSVSSIYMGQIFQRLSIYAALPNFGKAGAFLPP